MHGVADYVTQSNKAMAYLQKIQKIDNNFSELAAVGKLTFFQKVFHKMADKWLTGEVFPEGEAYGRK